MEKPSSPLAGGEGLATAKSPHRLEIRIRYAEVGRLGEVHLGQYAVYMEMGRTEMLRSTGMTYRELEAGGCYLVVARLRMTFHEAARYDDLLVLETEVSRATSARIDHRYRFLRGATVVAEGETTLASVSREGEVRRMPEALLRVLGVA